MDNKLFLTILTFLVIGIGAIFVLNGGGESEPDLSSEEISEVLAIDEQNYRVKGSADAPVELVEFGDFGCGFCAQAAPQVEQLLAQYEDQVQFEFRPFSIPSGQNSVVAHRAAEAAGMQGKFFEMYELIYQQQQVWGQSTEAKEIIDGFAQQLELDMDQYQQDYRAAETLDIINDFKAEAADVGVTGTPAFFVNGELVETQGQYFQALDEAISNALAENNNNDSNQPSEAE